MNIKRGDNVKMLAGKDRGKSGRVLFVLPEQNLVVVEGLNLIKKHQRARRQGQKGQIISKERPVDLSRVQLICPKCGRSTRVGHRIEGDLKLRVCKKCSADI